MAEKKRGKKKKDKMKNRRGLSTVIVTLILVLIAIVAVTLLWVPVRNLIRQQLQATQARSQFFNEQLNVVGVYSNYPYINITIKKPSGEVKSSQNSTGSVQTSLQVDLYSVVDLSGSMMECYGITNIQCNNMHGNDYYTSSCNGLLVGARNGCTSDGGIWHTNPYWCESITSAQCTTLGGSSYTPSLCDTFSTSQDLGCTNYSGTLNDKITPMQNANTALINTIFGSSSTSRVGFVAFGTGIISNGSMSLTTNVNSLNSAMQNWSALDNTCICCGINNASARLQTQSSPGMMKSIILMSDGGSNVQCPQQNTGDAVQDAIKAASDANASLSNLVIYTVGVGSDVDAPTMTAIANAGGGKYYAVANTSDLVSVYQSIATQMQSTYTSLTAFNYLYLKIYNATDFYMVKETGIPDVFQTTTYNVNLQGQLSGTITRIEVYPVILTSSGQEVIGPMITYWQAF